MTRSRHDRRCLLIWSQVVQVLADLVFEVLCQPRFRPIDKHVQKEPCSWSIPFTVRHLTQRIARPVAAGAFDVLSTADLGYEMRR